MFPHWQSAVSNQAPLAQCGINKYVDLEYWAVTYGKSQALQIQLLENILKHAYSAKIGCKPHAQHHTLKQKQDVN